MPKRKAVIVTLTLIVALIGVLAYFAWKSGYLKISTSENNERRLSVIDARKVAEAGLVTLFESWKEPKLNEAYTLYDLSPSPSAYLFIVQDIYGRNGYVVVSASTRLRPIIESSQTADSPFERMVVLSNTITAATNYDPADIRNELIYLGGTNYYAKFTFREGESFEESFYVLDGSVAEPVTPEEMQEKYDFFKQLQEENAVEQWQEYGY